MTPGLVDEIVVVDLLALFLAVAAVEIIWYVVKKAFPDQVRDLGEAAGLHPDLELLPQAPCSRISAIVFGQMLPHLPP